MKSKLQPQIQFNLDTSIWRHDWRIYVPLILLILAGVALTGCETAKKPGDAGQTLTKALRHPPNYDTPEANFVAAPFGKLSSEFIDEYANQYVVFDCIYVSHKEGAILHKPGSLGVYKNIMSATVSSDYKLLDVVWNVQDRELGRPFTETKLNSRLKIYGYVLPAQKPWSLKTRQDIFMSPGFNMPVVLLIKAVPQ